MNTNNINSLNWSAWNDNVLFVKEPGKDAGIGVRPELLTSVDNQSIQFSFIDNNATKNTPIVSIRGINSKREPYGQIEAITKYGNLNSRLGTSMGAVRN